MRKTGIACLALFLFAVLAWPQNQHYIQIAWSSYTQGTDAATGINVYRSATTGGPYSKLNGSAIAITATSYNDTTCPVATACFYVLTTIDASGFESPYSTEVSATQPTGPLGLQGVKATAH
jgi:fibronectin type 3 domain-containing protein